MAHLLIYGGTFDPVHHGHLITCRAARELLAADRVLLVPAWVSPHKKEGPPTATSQQRLRMLELALEGGGGAADFAVDARELTRGAAGAPSYTIDTVQELQRQQPADRFTLLVGADQLPKFHLWHRVEELLATLPIAVMTRGAGGSTGPQIVREKLGPLADRLTPLPTPRIDISATDIRRRAHAGQPISFLVPAPVAAYIHEHQLYMDAPPT